MKALVIGSSGMVGGALLRVLDRSARQAIGTYLLRPMRGERSLDVRNAVEVRLCFEAVGPEIVFLSVNLPGGVDACERAPQETNNVHVRGTESVATETARCGATLVYYSTDAIFDGTAGPYSEEDEPAPINIYGRAKWAAERVVKRVAPDHLIIRTTSVFGWDRTSRNFAMQIWEKLKASQAFLASSDQWCNPTLADYLAEASVQLVRVGARGIYNVVGADRMSRFDLAVKLARALDLDPQGISRVATPELGQHARRPMQAGLTTCKLEKYLGEPPPCLNESLERFRASWSADKAPWPSTT